MNLINKFKNALKIKEPAPIPELYPNFNNVKEWIDAKVEYFINTYPDDAHDLFNPSAGDYIPRLIAAGTSNRVFNENLDYYKEIKLKHPKLVEEAKNHFQHWSYSTVGDSADYPKDYK